VWGAAPGNRTQAADVTARPRADKADAANRPGQMERSFLGRLSFGWRSTPRRCDPIALPA